MALPYIYQFSFFLFVKKNLHLYKGARLTLLAKAYKIRGLKSYENIDFMAILIFSFLKVLLYIHV